MTTLIHAPQGIISGHFTIPNNVTSIGEYAFQNCTGLTSITIPNSVTSIGQSAFSGCTGLTSITIPNSVTSIGRGAFSNCTGITSITIPNSVTSIGQSAFFNSGIWNNTPNNSVVYADKWVVGYKGTLSGSLSLRTDTVGIGNSAFFDRTGLTSITIPNSVTSIGNGAFHGCTGLTSVTLGTITSANFASTPLPAFPGNLRNVYFDVYFGGAGTYTTANPGNNAVWTKQ